MISWRETQEHYRLDVSHRGWMGIEAALSAFLAGGAIFMTLFMAQAMARHPRMWQRESSLWAVPPLIVALSLVSLRAALEYRRMRGWVEVSIRGGLVRWGGPRLPEMPAPVPVLKFEPIWEKGPGIVAWRSDGLLVPVMGPWKRLEFDRAKRLVEQLNACLDTRQASAALVDRRPL